MKGLFLLSLLILSIPAFAQLDKALIATDIASVDAMVAKAAGEKTGAPVLIAENGMLTSDMKNQLASLNIKTAILVGGPAVINPALADELQSMGYAVVRLWGIERTGTAIEVAKYFWPSSDCVVLADDTKDSNADTELQAPASSLASESGCPLIPVPKGTLPAEVLSLLNEINASEVKIVAKAAPDTAQLSKFKVKIIAGDKKKIETDVESEIETAVSKEGKKLKLVIVAAPSWRQALGIGAHPNDRTVVRFVTDVSQLPELIAKIKEKNITDVRVVGAPALADEINAQLTAAGITAKVASGEKATQIEKKILEELSEKWVEKRNAFEEKRKNQLSKIRERLLARLNETENDVGDEEIELAGLKAEGADAAKIAEIQAKIDTAKTKISGLKANVLSNNVDLTNRELAKLSDAIKEKKWELRDTIKLNVKAKLLQEEEKREDREQGVQNRLKEIEGKLAKLKEKCNSVPIEGLIEKVKSVTEQAQKAIQAGNYARGSQLLAEAKRHVESANRLGHVCEKESKIEEKLQKVVEKRVEKPRKIETKLPTLSIDSPKSSEAVSGSEVTVKAMVDNFNLKPAGGEAKAGEGHLHYYLDAQELRSPKTEVTFANLTAGSHTVRVELHNNDHSMLSPAVVQTIDITTRTSGGGSGY